MQFVRTKFGKPKNGGTTNKRPCRLSGVAAACLLLPMAAHAVDCNFKVQTFAPVVIIMNTTGFTEGPNALSGDSKVFLKNPVDWCRGWDLWWTRAGGFHSVSATCTILGKGDPRVYSINHIFGTIDRALSADCTIKPAELPADRSIIVTSLGPRPPTPR